MKERTTKVQKRFALTSARRVAPGILARFAKYRKTLLLLGAMAAVGIGMATMRANEAATPDPDFQLQTPAFKEGGDIPARFTCSGENVSPALSWTEPRSGTRSFALIVEDPDAPSGVWVHWVVYDLPANLRQLPENVPHTAHLSDGGRQGINDFHRVGYGGPCPPPGKAHRYFFHLYALNTLLNLPDRATRSDVDAAMSGHVLAEARLMGRYGR